MALINNYSNANRSRNRNLAGNTGICGNSASKMSSFNRLRDYSLSMAYGLPTGYAGQSSFSIPAKGCGLASIKRAVGSGSIPSDLAMGKDLSAALSGVGTISSSDMSLIISIVATLAGSGTISSGDLAAIQSLAATLSGSGTISSADAAMLVGMTATLAGIGGATASNALVGLAHISADITPFTALSTEGLAQSLLDNNDIETGYSLRESLRLILASLAGKLSGAPGTTITIRDVNDTVDRIVATVDANGNRTSVTKVVT